MNEGAKTGIYWVAALAMLVVAMLVSRAPENDNSTESLIGQPLFPSFTDPLAASILRITTFNEEQGELAKFEVAKDEQTGVWSLPSRNNYPADASEQMKDAANALVGVKVLDIQTENPEDHAQLGVLEPNVESLEAGDEGVGRLVVLKGQNNSTLASIIIGNAVKGSEDKRYARVPGQDPVYVVTLDDKPLSTKFEDWIEKDLLQLSSIDISDIEIQNYDAALEVGNSLALEKHYDVKLSVDGSNAWQLNSLVVYDEQGEPKDGTLAEGEKLATAKLNTLKNALDDLKIVDVAAKPKGMSENLKADKDLVSDQQAVLSLATRGFFPVTQGDILSANGEMLVTLKEGVQYVLRFGNVKGIDEGETEEDASQTDATEAKKADVAGSNRYLLVTARVDESKFPPPELAPIPKTIEELEAANAPTEKPADSTEPMGDDAPTSEPAEPTAPAEEPQKQQAEVMEKESAAKDAPSTEETPETEKPSDAPDTAVTEPASTPADAAEAIEGTTEQSGTGEATGSGQGQDGEASNAVEEATNSADSEAAPADDAPSVEEPSTPEVPAAEKSASETDAEPKADTPAEAMPSDDDQEETAEEKQERLEAEQEKITKENQRKLDERKDKLEAARRRVRELNGRFADWYYVIPESTYRQLRLSQDELIEKPAASLPSDPAAADEAANAPAFDFQGLGQ